MERGDRISYLHFPESDIRQVMQNRRWQHTIFISIILFLSIKTAMSSSTVTGFNSKSLKQGDPEPPPATQNFVLYEMRFCPYSERVLIYASQKGIRMEAVNINLSSKPDWFIAHKSPSGFVPVLEYDGKMLRDSHVMMEYFDDLFPETSILPKDPYLRAVQRLLAIQLEPLCDVIIHMSHTETLTGDTKKLEEELTKAEAKLQTDFYGGSTFGFADISLFSFMERLDIMRPYNNAHFLNETNFPKQFPKLAKWFAKMQAIPAVAAVQWPREQLTAFMINKANNKTDFDVGLPGSKTPINVKLEKKAV